MLFRTIKYPFQIWQQNLQGKEFVWYSISTKNFIYLVKIVRIYEHPPFEEKQLMFDQQLFRAFDCVIVYDLVTLSLYCKIKQSDRKEESR